MCQHQPQCPPAAAADRQAARVVASHPEQGWSLLCNGVVAFEDTGVLLPNGHSIPPHKSAHPKMTAPSAPVDPASDRMRRSTGGLNLPGPPCRSCSTR
jgi:hypothetical protein